MERDSGCLCDSSGSKSRFCAYSQVAEYAACGVMFVEGGAGPPNYARPTVLTIIQYL